MNSESCCCVDEQQAFCHQGEDCATDFTNVTHERHECRLEVILYFLVIAIEEVLRCRSK